MYTVLVGNQDDTLHSKHQHSLLCDEMPDNNNKTKPELQPQLSDQSDSVFDPMKFLWQPAIAVGAVPGLDPPDMAAYGMNWVGILCTIDYNLRSLHNCLQYRYNSVYVTQYTYDNFFLRSHLSFQTRISQPNTHKRLHFCETTFSICFMGSLNKGNVHSTGSMGVYVQAWSSIGERGIYSAISDLSTDLVVSYQRVCLMEESHYRVTTVLSLVPLLHNYLQQVQVYIII